MDLNVFRGLMTLAFLIAFLAIVRYAWASRNRSRFDEAARLPLDEPDSAPFAGAAEGGRRV